MLHSDAVKIRDKMIPDEKEFYSVDHDTPVALSSLRLADKQQSQVENI